VSQQISLATGQLQLGCTVPFTKSNGPKATVDHRNGCAPNH